MKHTYEEDVKTIMDALVEGSEAHEAMKRLIKMTEQLQEFLERLVRMETEKEEKFDA